MRVSDIPTNREVRLQDPMQNGEESKLLSFKMEVLKCVKNYVSQNCSEGDKQETNLSKEEIDGIKSLKRRAKD